MLSRRARLERAWWGESEGCPGANAGTPLGSKLKKSCHHEARPPSHLSCRAFIVAHAQQMAEPEVVIPDDGAGDEDMAEVEGLEGMGADNEPTGLEDIEPTLADRTTFLE